MTAKVIRNRFRDEYSRALAAIPNRDTENLYVEEAKKGNRAALQTLTYKYIPFLYKMANQLRNTAYNLTVDELVDSAVFGLHKAVQSFDSTRGVSFCTYYSAKAMNEMKKAAFDSILVHHPENQLKSKDKDKKSVAMVPIDRKDDERKLSIMDMLSCSSRTDDNIKKTEHAELAQQFMSLLMPAEHEVMSRMYLFDDHDVTLRSVGRDMNMSHERVRQIKAAAMRRIHKSEKYEDMMAERTYLHNEAV